MTIHSYESNHTQEIPVVPAASRREHDPIPFDDHDLVAEWGDRRHRIAGVELVGRDPRAAALDIARAAVLPERLHGEHIHLLNAWSIALADEDDRLGTGVLRHEHVWNLPDGKPLTWLGGRVRTVSRLTQVRGPQLMLDVADVGRSLGVNHFLLGSTPETLAKLEANLATAFPGISIVGRVSPPFRVPTDEERDELDETIRRSGAHIVWVGLGTPKQDFESLRIAQRHSLIAVAVGAAFDYAAGTLRPAPSVFRRASMEWFWRLCCEPRRLWRRYTIGSARFLLVAFRDRRAMARAAADGPARDRPQELVADCDR